jgi:hypothetical protein
MKLIDRCTNCKYLTEKNNLNSFKANICLKRVTYNIDKNGYTSNIKEISGFANVILQPENFGCIHWGERKNNE